MNIVSRCVQDIIKYGNECKGMIGLVVMAICLGAVGKRIYSREKGVECLPASRFFYRLFIRVCNGAYFVYSFYITFGIRYVGMRREVEWIPFVSVWQRPGEYPLLVENVLLFIPFGFLMPLTFYKMRKGKQVALGALVISILIETVQYVFQCGKTEVDDVILNCLGAMIGYGLFVLGSRGKNFIMKCYKTPCYKAGG